jgi:hypothetical protein
MLHECICKQSLFGTHKSGVIPNVHTFEMTYQQQFVDARILGVAIRKFHGNRLRFDAMIAGKNGVGVLHAELSNIE